MTNLLNSNIADHLIAARQNRRQWDAKNTSPPASIGDAYAIQDLVLARLNVNVSGWKTSAPDLVSIPIAAPIYSDRMVVSGTSIAASNLSVIGIEGEIAFRIGRDLPALDIPYSSNDLGDAVSGLLPVIEIVDTRIVDGLKADKNLVLADNQSNGYLVYGQVLTSWRGLNFSALAASVRVNGITAYSGVDGNRAGALFKLMAWAANHCANRGRPFRAGDLVTTGTYTGMIFVEPGSEVVVDFPGIGQVTVSFPD